MNYRKARRHRMRIAWLVWFFAAIFVLFQFFLQLSSGVIVQSVMKTFSLSAFGGGLLMSSYYYIYVLLQTPAGALIDRFGPRWILTKGAFFVAIGCFLFATAKTFSMALIGRILMGGGASFAFVGCMNVVSIWFPSRRFAFMTAIVETSGMFGAIAGNFWLADAIHKVGWQRCLFAAAIFAVVLAVGLFLFVRNAPRPHRAVKKSLAFNTFLFSVKKLIKNPLIWMNGFYSGAMFGVVTVFIALWAIPFFQVAYHVNLWTASAIASCLYVGIAVGGPFLGWLDARMRSRHIVMITNAFVTAICLYIVIFATGLPLFALCLLLFLAGITTSSYVLTFAIANELGGTAYRATAIGFTNMLCVAMAPLMQPLIGFLLHHASGSGELVKHFQWAVSLVPLLLIISGIFAFSFKTKN